MFNRNVLSLLLLFVATLSYGQQPIVVGDAILTKDLELARETISRATPKSIQFQTGEFDVIGQATAEPITWLQIPGATGPEDFIKLIPLKPNQVVNLVARKRGDTEVKLHEVKNGDKPALLVWAMKTGSRTWFLVKNNKDPLQGPQQVDTVVIIVGTPPPKPDDPDPNEPDDGRLDQALTARLKTAFDKDVAAKIGDKAWVQKLSGLYNSAAKDDLTEFATIADLDEFLDQARQAAGIPDYQKALTELRAQIRQEIFTAMKITEADRTKAMTATDIKAAKAVFGKLSNSLKSIGK